MKNCVELLGRERMGLKNRIECLAEYGSDYKIQKMVDEGTLFKISKGVYSDSKYVPEIAVILFRYPEAVVTMRNAFYIYGLTDVIPDKYDLALGRNSTKISDKCVRQYFVNDSFFHEGVVPMDYKGYPIRIYNRERMLIELLRYKSKLPFDYYKEIIHSFRRIVPSLNLELVQDYAYVSPKSQMIMELLQLEVL